ncbi:MAG: TonB-dependent receptor [Pseudomonadales bacterium]|nr:TonB-dependent receptor [Pseudomonadales bacterium]MCP5185778.1 TonB-dependent receptor [Pseudomonadales bacterium]
MSPAFLDIASGPLDKALIEYGKQAGISIVFGQEGVEGVQAPAIRGRFTPEAALRKLLDNLCFSADWIRPSLVAVKPGCPSTDKDVSTPATLAEQVLSLPPGTEEIVVTEQRSTGTLLSGKGVSIPVPMDQISRPEIDLSGRQTLSQLLRYSPAVAGNSTSTLVTNGGDGSATVTLRGLPASNTLVLLNGRRLNPDAFFGHAVDLNVLPLAMIDRVEILRDGASAVYGSDAVAGVINVHTRRDIRGLLLDAFIGSTSDGAQSTQHVSALWGWDGQAATLTGGISLFRQDPLYSRQRALSSTSDDRGRGGIDQRSSATLPARIQLVSGPVVYDVAQGGDPSLASSYRAASDEDRFEYRDYTTLSVPSTRSAVFLDGQWQLHPSTQAFIEVLGSRYQATSQLAPTPLFTAFDNLPIPIAAEQPFNPFGEVIEDLRLRFAPLGARKQHNRSQSARVVAGLEGDLGFGRWDLAAVWSRTWAHEKFGNGVNALRVQEALSPECIAPCVALNVFGPEWSIQQPMLDYIRTEAKSSGVSALKSLTFNLESAPFELPAGPIDIAFGGELRRETLSSRPDPLLQAGLLLGSGNFQPTNGSRDIWEIYAESRLPLLTQRRGARILELFLAARHSHYSEFGNETNPRVVLRWEPVSNIALRASWARAFRAPDLHQLFGGTVQSFQQLNDPCTLTDNAARLAGCQQPSDPTLTQFFTIEGGSDELEPERSRTISLGLDVRGAIHDAALKGSVNLFDIDQKDVVDTNAQFIINANAESGMFSDRVLRDANGNISRIRANLLNIGHRRVQGVDISGSIAFPVADRGHFEIALQATHLAHFKDQVAPDQPTLEQAGTFRDAAASGNGALPKWKTNLALRWRRNYWRAQYDIFVVSTLKEIVPIRETRREMELWAIHNLQFSYLGPTTGWVRISMGFNNLFNEPPPFSAAAFNDSYDSRTYDITGRFGYLRLERAL